jgi:hypothetical protein
MLLVVVLHDSGGLGTRHGLEKDDSRLPRKLATPSRMRYLGQTMPTSYIPRGRVLVPRLTPLNIRNKPAIEYAAQNPAALAVPC